MTRRDFMLGASGAALAAGAGAGRAAGAPLSLAREAGGWNVRAGDRLLLVYRSAPVEGPAGTAALFTRNAYVHPVHAPNGALVTDDFPADHLHQRGVYFAWTKTRIELDGQELHPDFWNIGAGTGRIRTTRVRGEMRPDGLVRLEASHTWEARRGEDWVPVLSEVCEIQVHPPTWTDPDAGDAYYRLDFTSRQTPRVALELPQYRYGGMAVRGARPWNDRKVGKLVTAEGREWFAAEGHPARWVDMSGPSEEKVGGIALWEHPSNPGAPSQLRVAEQNPYYVYCPSKAAALTLAAGKEHQFRYGLCVHNGPVNPELLKGLVSG